MKQKKVLWAEQQVIKKRTKRDFVDQDQDQYEEKLNDKRAEYRSTKYDDPEWNSQWYLRDVRTLDESPKPLDLNVIPVWKRGITGKGVVVSVIDDG